MANEKSAPVSVTLTVEQWGALSGLTQAVLDLQTMYAVQGLPSALNLSDKVALLRDVPAVIMRSVTAAANAMGWDDPHPWVDDTGHRYDDNVRQYLDAPDATEGEFPGTGKRFYYSPRPQEPGKV